MKRQTHDLNLDDSQNRDAAANAAASVLDEPSGPPSKRQKTADGQHDGNVHGNESFESSNNNNNRNDFL